MCHSTKRLTLCSQQVCVLPRNTPDSLLVATPCHSKTGRLGCSGQITAAPARQLHNFAGQCGTQSAFPLLSLYGKMKSSEPTGMQVVGMSCMHGLHVGGFGHLEHCSWQFLRHACAVLTGGTRKSPLSYVGQARWQHDHYSLQLSSGNVVDDLAVVDDLHAGETCKDPIQISKCTSLSYTR